MPWDAAYIASVTAAAAKAGTKREVSPAEYGAQELARWTGTTIPGSEYQKYITPAGATPSEKVTTAAPRKGEEAIGEAIYRLVNGEWRQITDPSQVQAGDVLARTGKTAHTLTESEAAQLRGETKKRPPEEKTIEELIEELTLEKPPEVKPQVVTDQDALSWLSLFYDPADITPELINWAKQSLQMTESETDYDARVMAVKEFETELNRLVTLWEMERQNELDELARLGQISDQEYQNRQLALQQQIATRSANIDTMMMQLRQKEATSEAGQFARQMALEEEESAWARQQQEQQFALEQQQWAWQQEQAIQTAARQSQQDLQALEQQLWARGATQQEFQLAEQQFQAQQDLLAQQFGLTQEQWRWEQQQATQQFGLTQEQWAWQQQQAAQQFGITQEQWLHEQEQARLAQEQQLWSRGITETQMTQQYGLQQQELGLARQALSWQQEQAAEQARIQQQNYLASLAARPMSWLEYAGAAGETPAVQPWMQPLMPQQYQQLGAGAAIPGYTPESMTGMPALTTPSRQYQARMGPTAQQQFLGYRQARTGARPEETEFRLWSQAPPAGRSRGLSYAR